MERPHKNKQQSPVDKLPRLDISAESKKYDIRDPRFERNKNLVIQKSSFRSSFSMFS